MSVPPQLLEGSDVDLGAALAAFRFGSDAGHRALITIKLSQIKQDLVETFHSRLARIVLSTAEDENKEKRDDDEEEVYAAIRLLTTLFSIRQEEAHVLVFDCSLLVGLLKRSILSSQEDLRLACFVADLINAAANHANSRKHILKDHAERQVQDRKIKEVKENLDEELDTIVWLLSFMERAIVENASTTSMLGKVALFAAMAMHKIRKDQRSNVSEGLTNGDGYEEHSEKAQVREQRDLDDDLLLSSLAEDFLLADEALAPERTALSDSVHEVSRMCKLASVEALAYLTIEVPYRMLIAYKSVLLQRICKMGIQSVVGSEEYQRTLFPMRGNSDKIQITSSYEADRALDHPQIFFQHFSDSALQYGLAVILRNLTAYPPMLSTEEKQMDRLRKMANAKTSVKGRDDHVEDEGMDTKSIEDRCSAVIEARGAEMLSSIALGNSESKQVKGSLALRETISTALLSLTSKQDRLQRGKIIQQGGAKALVVLSNEKLADTRKGNQTQSKASFDAMQALSQLLITEDPRIVLQNPIEAVPALLFTYLHSTSSRLQRFEAALALTNLASLDERMSQLIVRFSFPKEIIDARAAEDFVGAGATEASHTKVDLSNLLHERIFLEDNEMCRRSSLELLCNLLASDETLFKQWTGELEDECDENLEERQLKEGKTTKNLSFLLALCAPMGRDKISNETGLKLRMATSGVLATLASSPSTCIRLFNVEDRLLRRMAQLLSFPSVGKVKEAESVEEAKLHIEDISEDIQGEYHATLQLALRSLTVLNCLIQYISWLQGQSSRDVTLYKSKLIDSGYIDAMKKFALSLASTAKQVQQTPAIQSLHDEVAQQAFSILRTSKTLQLI